jgi:alpha-tubulin suppressor-like RCC1 family protein
MPIMRITGLIVAALLLAPHAVLPQSDTRDPVGEPAFTQLTAGDRFTCGLTQEGKAYCWGQDNLGQLGIGPPVGWCAASQYATGPCARAPVAVAGEHRFVSIVAGSDHTCALDKEGAAYCWGGNHFDELGTRDAVDRCEAHDMYVACSRTPARVSLTEPLVSIAAGEHITCAVGREGRAWCWGVVREPLPVRVDQPLVAIAAGGDYVCGLTSLKAIRCLSWPEDMETGAVSLGDRTGWKSLSAGTRHGCGLDADDTAFCWGSDADGALGAGPSSHVKYDVVPVSRVETLVRFRAIATGVKRTCAIDRNDALYCWGRVAEGRPDDRCLDSNGVANTNDCTTRPIAVHQSTRFRTIAIGASHQCGVTSSGITVCWGANESGQLGVGTLAATNEPVAVRTGGVTTREIFLLDAKEQIVWWGPRGGLALVVFCVVFVAARGWWRSGVDDPSPESVSPRAGVSALVVALSAWALVFYVALSLSASSGTGDVAYGLAMMGLVMSGGTALAMSLIASVMSLVTLRRQRGAKFARIALALAALMFLSCAGLGLWMFRGNNG